MKRTKFFNNIERKWVLIDAKDKVLGRLSTQIAKILQGKNKPTYSPNFLTGDRVIVVNVKHLRLTANKPEQKVYDKYTGYPSGRKEMSFKVLMDKSPEKALAMAVKGMLPKSNLGVQMFRSLKIYAEDQHGHQAQKPEKVNS